MSSDLSMARVFAALILLAVPAVAQKAVSAAEAAQLAFVGCKIERQRVTLSAAQQAVVKKRAAVRRVPAVMVRFVARRGGVIAGSAYVETRRVRTKAQQLLIVLSNHGKVRRIEVLAWKEPRRFRPKPAFFAQFRGKGLDGTLRLRRGIRPVTGATRSASAAVDAVRTVLAVHELK